jgi:hypothetical protein
MAETLTYYAYDEAAPLACRSCGWRGTMREGSREFYSELFDVSCPRCDTMLLIVPYPTPDEIRQAAAAGDVRALEELANLERAEGSRARFERVKLKRADELPDVEGDGLEFVWDWEGHEPGETVIRLGEREIWREPARWEGYERFDAVKAILKERYGSRFRSLTPTERSTLYLYGDGMHGYDLRFD